MKKSSLKLLTIVSALIIFFCGCSNKLENSIENVSSTTSISDNTTSDVSQNINDNSSSISESDNNSSDTSINSSLSSINNNSKVVYSDTSSSQSQNTSQSKEQNSNNNNSSYNQNNSSSSTPNLNSNPQQQNNNQTNNTDIPQVSISIDCINASNIKLYEKLGEKVVPKDGIILSETYMTFKQGLSAYDVLKTIAKKNNIILSTKGIGERVYIAGINGLKEFDGGQFSGWIYTINGKTPDVGIGSYKLSAGDKIKLRYTVKIGDV